MYNVRYLHTLVRGHFETSTVSAHNNIERNREKTEMLFLTNKIFNSILNQDRHFCFRHYWYHDMSSKFQLTKSSKMLFLTNEKRPEHHASYIGEGKMYPTLDSPWPRPRLRDNKWTATASPPWMPLASSGADNCRNPRVCFSTAWDQALDNSKHFNCFHLHIHW